MTPTQMTPTMERASDTPAPTGRQARLAATVDETPGGEAYVIESPVPGRTPEAITITAMPESVTVTIQGVPADPESGERYLQQEYALPPASRVFEFPELIDPDHIEATLTNGILRIKVPKAAAGRRTEIRIAPAG
jgi:HSP20 family protein